MTRFAACSAFVLFATAASSATARADSPDSSALPSVSREHDADEPANKLYIASGAALSLLPEAILVASVSFESGQHLLGSLWAHEQLSIGTGSELFGPQTDVFGARAGLAFRACTKAGYACVESGVDLAVAHLQSSGMETRFIQEDHTSDVAFAVPRVVGELGTRNVHLRPSLGMMVGSTLGLELGLGVQVGW